jgi:hypothetical protein
MASSSKKRTTMAKLTRENKLRERRFDKQAKKSARKLGLTDPPAQADQAAEAVRADESAPSSGAVVA